MEQRRHALDCGREEKEMIEAIIVCVALDAMMQSCSTWKYKEPMERTTENLEQVIMECADIVREMEKKGFSVTCEEDKNVSE